RKEEEKQKGGELTQKRQPNRSLEADLLPSTWGHKTRPRGLEPNRRYPDPQEERNIDARHCL
ncbi:hypothetical protein NDU88_005275, partial [Pleurodeles waltl]